MTQTDTLAKTIAGEATLSENPGATLKKWRQIFGLTQTQISKNMKVTASVISDYEAGKRMPGTGFVKKFIKAMIRADKETGGKTIRKFEAREKPKAILDIQEFLTPMPAKKFLNAIKAKIITGKKQVKNLDLMGYTVIDSLKAILELTEKEFSRIYGATTERALVFTQVHMGRSPMVALKVTNPKPALIALNGLAVGQVDRLAVKIAESINVPLAVSQIKTQEELVESLRANTNR